MTTTIFLPFSTVSRLGTARGSWRRRRGPVQGHPGPVEREVSGDRPAEVVVGYVVVGRDSERVREERPAVSPHPGLARRRRHARNDQDRRHGDETHAPLAPQG